MRHFDLFIDGAFRPAADGRTVEGIDPATEAPWATFAAAGRADVDAALDAARRAFDEGPWPQMSRGERADILEAIGVAISERQDELIEAEVCDGGGTIRKATIADIPAAAMTFQHFATLLREHAGDEEHTEDTPVPSRNLIVREPFGVVSAIVPWNFPLAGASWKVAPALAAGNTLVLKPSPQTPATALLLAEICHQAGVPAGAFSVVSAPEDNLGERLVTHPHVDKVAFTGSTRVGQHIMRLAADRVTPVTLELGGKSPNIILDDADLDCAARGALFGTFFHNGQICTSGTRVLVPRAHYGAFVERMVEGARKLRIGPPSDFDSDMGPLVSARHWKNVDGYVRIALEEGARCVTGGGRPEGLDVGYYYQPTIFADVRNDMRIAREEVFGPVVCVIPYDGGDDAAVRIANETEFGLAAAVWSKDTERALKVARRVKAGTVWVNDYHLLSPRFPFGGYKRSGIGRELGTYGFDDYCQIKHIHVGEPSSAEEKSYFGLLLGDA